MRLTLRFVAVTLGLVVALGQGALAVDIVWEGTLVVVEEDSGTGAYTGGTPDASMFSGSVNFPGTCGATCLVEPFPPFATNYVFSDGSGTISGLGSSSTGIESSIEVINDEVVGPDAVELAAFFGVTLTVGQTLDVWAVNSETAGEFTPAFVDWGLSYVYSTSNPFSDTSFTPTPPPDPDFILWQINEDDGDAYSALGVVMPEPGGIPMLAAGVILVQQLAARSRRTVRAR